MTNTHIDLAKLSEVVYDKPARDKPQGGYASNLPLGYNYIASSGNTESSEGYFGAAFKNGNTIVIAHRGTDSLSDIDDDYAIFIGKKLPDQAKEAEQFTKQIKMQFGNDGEIIHTGHSLGGGIAQIMAFTNNHRAVSFDNPGIGGIALNNWGIGSINIDLITAYVSAPNAFNTCGEHLVPPIQLDRSFVPQSDYHIGVTNYLSYSYAVHAIDGIIASFDPITCEPKGVVRYKEWPQGFNAGFVQYVKTTLSHATKAYRVNGMDEKHVSRLYDIAMDRVIEDYSADVDLLGTITKTFTIIPQYSAIVLNNTEDNAVTRPLDGHDKECVEKEEHFFDLIQKQIKPYNDVAKLLDYPLISSWHDLPENDDCRYKYCKSDFIDQFINRAIEYSCLNFANMLITQFNATISANSLDVLVRGYGPDEYQAEMADWLIKRGVSPSLSDIGMAIRKQKIELTRVLLQNVNFSLGALYAGCIKNIIELKDIGLVKIILNHGIDVNIKLSPIERGDGQYQCFGNPLDYSINLFLETFSYQNEVVNRSKLFNIIKLLLKYGADTNTPSNYHGRYDYGHTDYVPCAKYFPLGIVVDENLTVLAKLLLEHGADPNLAYLDRSSKSKGLDLINIAISRDNIALVNLLLQYGASVNSDDAYYQPIEKVVRNQRFDMVKSILEHSSGSSNNQLPKSSLLEAIDAAINIDAADVVNLIFHYYHNLSFEGDIDNCILMHAIAKQNLIIVTSLIKHHSNANGLCYYSKEEYQYIDYDSIKTQKDLLIVQAVKTNNTDLVKALLADKAIKLDLSDEYNPLLNAIKQNNTQMVEDLLIAGANPNFKVPFNIGSFGENVTCYVTILNEAITAKNLIIVELLLKGGASTNISSINWSEIDEWSNSLCESLEDLYPMQRAIESNNLELSELLLSYEADQNVYSEYTKYDDDISNESLQ